MDHSTAISKGSLTTPDDPDDSSGDGGSDGKSVRTFISREGYKTLESGSQVRKRGAIAVAGYVLSHAAINITNAIDISDVLFGIILLVVATTLPEKFVAVMSGHREHIGILVANMVGSNIFLLSLCMGIIMVDTSREFNDGNINIRELAVLWGLTLVSTLTVWTGGRFDR
ncbi:hypothetical protein F5Y12DRAFT_794408 [Xylaria sp. FL1777]|nr:hypothetical protein F5Y12DRAFT_794408 [Xylaria sp. FL1777]